jgi:hypothetical protein
MLIGDDADKYRTSLRWELWAVSLSGATYKSSTSKISYEEYKEILYDEWKRVNKLGEDNK